MGMGNGNREQKWGIRMKNGNGEWERELEHGTHGNEE